MPILVHVKQVIGSQCQTDLFDRLVAKGEVANYLWAEGLTEGIILTRQGISENEEENQTPFLKNRLELIYNKFKLAYLNNSI